MPPSSHSGAAAPPDDFDALRDMVLAQKVRLSPRLRQVGAYALEHPDEIAFGTTASIAAAIDAQPSTLVRFARALGFEGFTALQKVFRDRLRDLPAAYDERMRAIAGGGDHAPLLHGVLAAAYESLDRAKAGICPEKFAQVAEILAGAETIYLIARGRAFPVAAYLAYALGRLRIRYQLIPAMAGSDLDILAAATPRDAGFAVSFSPYTPDTVAAAHALAQRGIPVTALTDSMFSPLTADCSHWLELPEASFGDFRSLSASMAVAMALVLAAADRRKEMRA